MLVGESSVLDLVCEDIIELCHVHLLAAQPLESRQTRRNVVVWRALQRATREVFDLNSVGRWAPQENLD